MVTSVHTPPPIWMGYVYWNLHDSVISIQSSKKWVVSIQISQMGHIFSTFHLPRMGHIYSNLHIPQSTNGSCLFKLPPSMDHIYSNLHPAWLGLIYEWVLSTSTQMDHLIIYFFKPQRMKHFYSDHIQIIAIQTSTNGSYLDVFKQVLFSCDLERFTEICRNIGVHIFTSAQRNMTDSHILRISEKTKQNKKQKTVALCKGISSHGMKTWDNRHRPAHVTTGLIALRLRRRLSVMGNLDVDIDSQAFDSKLDTRSASCTWPNCQQIKHHLA